MKRPSPSAQTRRAAAWKILSPEAAGMDSQLPAKLRAAVKSGLIPGLHACLIVRNGAIAAEAYFEGEDANWGRPIGMVKHGPGTLHDLRSVTKSIVSLLYGIALGRGLVPPPEAPLMAEFPHFADLAKDVGRQQWTIAHALTMSLGTEWNEEVPYTDPANSEIQMEHAADRSRFVLDRPLREAPGTRWVYNGGTSALIAEIIERGTGKSLLDFAHEALFVPLGIVRVEWNAGRDGKHSAASGLRLSARDLSRIGQMLLERGRAGGLQIVSGAWIDQSTAPRIETGEGLSYGYQWWLGAAAPGLRRSAEQRWFAGFRNGGQRLFVMPAAKLAMVTYFGNYDRMDSWKFPIRLWWEIVLPSLVPLK